jgi:hypothetical protein
MSKRKTEIGKKTASWEICGTERRKNMAGYGGKESQGRRTYVERPGYYRMTKNRKQQRKKKRRRSSDHIKCLSQYLQNMYHRHIQHQNLGNMQHSLPYLK